MWKLSVHTGDFPQNKTVDEIFSTVKNLGLKYVEIPYLSKFIIKEKINDAKPQLKEKKSQVSCIDNWCSFQGDYYKKENGELINDSIDIALELRAKYVRVGPFEPVKSNDVFAAMKEYKRNIGCCLKKAEDNNIVLLLENEFGNDPTKSAVQCREIMEFMDSPCFKLLYDPGNFYIGGEEPYPYAYNLLKEFIGYIHIKDAVKIKDWMLEKKEKRGKKEECFYLDSKGNYIWKEGSSDFICVALGEGGVNYYGFLNTLINDRYDGFLSIEPHAREEIHTETMRRTIEFVESIERSIKNG